MVRIWKFSSTLPLMGATIFPRMWHFRLYISYQSSDRSPRFTPFFNFLQYSSLPTNCWSTSISITLGVPFHGLLGNVWPPRGVWLIRFHFLLLISAKTGFCLVVLIDRHYWYCQTSWLWVFLESALHCSNVPACFACCWRVAFSFLCISLLPPNFT